MSSFALALPNRRLVSSDLLKLRRRRGLLLVTGLLTIGVVVIANAVSETMHLINPTAHGPAGGVTMLGHLGWTIATLGAVAATIAGAVAGSGDSDAGVYRELVVTGRSRPSLFLSRIPAAVAFVLPFVAVAYALEAGASVVFAGFHPAPSTYLLAITGLWVVLSVVVYFLLAYGLASATGSRAYSIGIVLAFKLAVTPLVASIAALGVVRELLPGVALDNLIPAVFGGAARQGPAIAMSIAATAAVLVVWTAAALLVGGWRDTSRDA
jgi:hypothetical protein